LPKKTPKVKFEPHPSKSPKIAEDPDRYMHLNPAWRISKLEFNDPFGWHEIDAMTLRCIQEKLSSFESMTWSEILIVAKKQNHNVEVYKLCKEAINRLEELGLDDLDQLLSLRLQGKERIWGILERGVITLLWWDPEHQVCPSLLKNT
jgi:hypothetical protein